MNRFLRVRTLALTTTMTAVAVAMQVAVGATAAEARCSGPIPVVSTLGTVAQERPKPVGGDAGATCNNNGAYTGQIMALLPDTVVTVYVQNNGNWDVYKSAYYGQGWVDYTYGDANSYSLLVLCWLRFSDGTDRCGWGDNQGPQGWDPKGHPNYFSDRTTQPIYNGVNSGF